MPVQQPDYVLTDEYQQLALKLDLAEVEVDGLPMDEARIRSEAARAALEKSVRAPWLEEYLKLREGGWPWRQAAYIAWASTPRDGRNPKTQDELARDYLGLTTDRAISTWRRRNPAILEMIAILQAAPLWEQRADHFKALNDGAARAGNDYKFFNHLKLAMEMRGDYIPASRLSAELRKKITGDLSDLSDEDLAALAKALEVEGE